jgi:hypothetical protein
MKKVVSRSVLFPAATAVALVVALGVALAANPHFIFARVSLDNDGDLQIKFKEAGLGQNQNITYEANADATATYQCVNNGGKCPKAANKTDVAGPVSNTGTFSSGKNGQINATLTVSPPDPGDFSCPPGQNLEVAAVQYSNITLVDTTNGIIAPVDKTEIGFQGNVCP